MTASIDRSTFLPAMIVFLIIAGLTPLHPGSAKETMREPWAATQAACSEQTLPYESVEQLVVRILIEGYQETIGPEISTGCPSYPSCSTYMRQAVDQYNLPGIILGLERLLHEADEVVMGQTIRIDGQLLVFDPLDNNTYWWKTRP